MPESANCQPNRPPQKRCARSGSAAGNSTWPTSPAISPPSVGVPRDATSAPPTGVEGDRRPRRRAGDRRARGRFGASGAEPGRLRGRAGGRTRGGRMLLEGRRAIITGASSGIGRACAERFGREGASVCVNYFSEGERHDADQVVATVESAGGKALAFQADVGDESQVTAMVEQTVATFGGLDVLVNNAGIENEVPTLELTLADWERVLRTNLTGSFLCLREAGKRMAKAGGGVIVNMSSVHEFIPWPGFAHYCASKGALKLLMATAAREWAPRNIRVVNVAPGAIATPINTFVLDDP